MESDNGRTEQEVFSVDEILAALSAQQRRYILYYLREERTATVDDLAQQLVAWEEECPVESVSMPDMEQQRIQLYHEHLPELADAHLLEFDDRSNTVCYSHPPTLLERFLDVSAKLESPLR